jgi:hypothetical protein
MVAGAGYAECYTEPERYWLGAIVGPRYARAWPIPNLRAGRVVGAAVLIPTSLA